MPSYTTSLRLTQPTVGGDNAQAWATALDTDMTLLEDAICGDNEVSIAGLTTYTLTANNGATDQARGFYIRFTGALAAGCTVTIPSVSRVGFMANNTTGGFAVTVTTGSGRTMVIQPALANTAPFMSGYVCDGTNVDKWIPDALSYRVDNSHAYAACKTTGVAMSMLTCDGSNNTILSNDASGRVILQNNSINALEVGTDGKLYYGTGNAAPINNQVAGFTIDQQGRANWYTANNGSMIDLGVATGDTVYLRFFYNGVNQVGSVTTNGTTTAFNTSSDYRLKTIVGQYIPGNLFDQITVYNGTWNTKTQAPSVKPEPMILAHEIQALFPHAVTGDKDAVNSDGSIVPQMWDSSMLIPAMLAELKALRARVAALEGHAAPSLVQTA